MDQQDLTRLMDLDESLASAGLHYGKAADRHGVTTKTIQRLVALIRATGRETVLDQSAETGRMAIHRYAPGVPRLFLPPDMIAVPRGGRPGRDSATRDEVARLLDQGMSYLVIAKLAGVGEATVKRWAKDAGVKRTRGPKPKSS